MGVKIDSIGVFENNDGAVTTALELCRRAATPCIEQSTCKKEDIGLVVSVSVYRDQYFCEPSFSSYVQNDLAINQDKTDSKDPKTLSLDVLNGAMGLLNACQLTHAMLTSGKVKAGLVVSSDVVDENVSKKGSPPGFHPCGTAMILSNGTDDDSGFKSFSFRTFTDRQDACVSYFFHDTDKHMRLFFQREPAVENIYLDAISVAVSEFIRQEGVALNDFDMIIPSQISSDFIAKMADMLGVAPEMMIDVTKNADLFNASLPMAMNQVMKNNQELPGKKALIVNVASGIQVGCAIYEF